MEQFLRRIMPSAVRLSYNPFFKFFGNTAANCLGFPFQDFRNLPPNHLRVRVGVGNKVFNNHDYHIRIGQEYWFEWLSQGYCHSKSDITEIGCGRIAQHLLGQWFKGTYRGVDIDPEQIAYCRKRFSDPRFTFAVSTHRSKTYKGDEGRLAAKNYRGLVGGDESKDFIFSTSLFTHLLEPHINDYLEACFRSLRSSSMIYMPFFCLEHVTLGGGGPSNTKSAKPFANP